MRKFKFLQTDLTIYRLIRYTTMDNKVGTMNLPWRPHPEVKDLIDLPLTFKGTMIRFFFEMCLRNQRPVIYEIDLRRAGWFRTHITYNCPSLMRIRKHDKLIIYYDILDI